MSAGERDTAHESVLERANALLSAFSPRHRTLSLSGIVMRTGLPKSTAHRTAQQMIKLGWLNYRDGPRCLDPPPVRQPFEADTSAGRGIKPNQTANTVNSDHFSPSYGLAPESG